ncbi:MAG: hypothetical protein A2X57_09665 [Nitrospirae bacterium GWD2_57_8]|nr:MAG: hypothetical protein A2X57_09665 [Nitrospirae bacterium GWD2_57_8]
MTDGHGGAGFFQKAGDKFVFRLVIYAFLVLLVGFIAFIADVLLDRYDFTLFKQAAADGFVSGFAVFVGLCLFELYLYKSRGRARQLETDARTADTMLLAVAQAIPDLVFIKDAEGRHLMVNKAVEEFTGQAAQHLYGKTMADLLPSDLAAACTLSDSEPITTGKPCRVEERFTTAAGLRILDTIKTPLRNDQGDIIGIVGISRDITEKINAEEERRLLQAQLLQSQKMEALGHLAGGIAHDFSNVLTVIMGFTDVLKKKLTNDEILMQQADQILEASLRARTLIKGLFAFSSRQKIDRKPLNLNDIINGGRKLLLQMINERIAIKMNCCDAPLTVMGDQLQLERVIMNLAANAQDGMPDGGDLVFNTASVAMGDDFINTHGYGVPGSYALLTVSDRGIGVPEENKTKIFEPFFTTKEAEKGTGLGLAIVYGIIKQHNGFINVSSPPGQGTTFSVFLPLAKSV